MFTKEKLETYLKQLKVLHPEYEIDAEKLSDVLNRKDKTKLWLEILARCSMVFPIKPDSIPLEGDIKFPDAVPLNLVILATFQGMQDEIDRLKESVEKLQCPSKGKTTIIRGR